MKSRERKSTDIEQLRQDLADSPTLFVCKFEGLKVAEDYELRKQIRGAGAQYRVVQNRLVKQASEGTPYEPVLSGLQGMTSLAFGGDDPVGLVKTLLAYGKDHPVFAFQAGVVEGRVLDLDGLNQLATLPGRDDLNAKLLYLIQSPAQRLVSVINAAGRDLAVVINQAVDEKKFTA
jgi:large subunit ribosomal protein L10